MAAPTRAETLGITDLSPEERASLRYLNYLTAPILIDAQTAVNDGTLVKKNDSIIFRPQGLIRERLQKPEIFIPLSKQYSFVPSTILGLNEALVRAEEGTPLRDQFEAELNNYNQQLARDQDLAPMGYGVWAYYPRYGDLVQFTPRHIHRLALVASNSTLFLDKEKRASWDQVQQIFRNTTPAIVGLSVGASIGFGISMVLRPDSMIVADPALYKLTNINRVPGLNYRHMLLSHAEKAKHQDILGLRNKAMVFSELTHEIDPFMNIYAYDVVNEANLSAFLGGNRIQRRATIIIEVCDSPDVKLHVAEEARKKGIRLIRFTDAGSTVRVDVRPFDIEPSIPLTYNADDQILYNLCKESESSKAAFFKFAAALVGPDHLERNDEFGMLVNGSLPRTVSSVPQLGSTVMAAGGWAGELVARMLLGHEFPERFILDLQHLTIEISGKWFPGLNQNLFNR